jgi:hypothetical protein
MKKHLLMLATIATVMNLYVAALLASQISLANAQETQTIETRIGKLTFEHSFERGIPTKETTKYLFDTIDFQRATQAYIWAIPIVSMYQWMNTHDQYGGERGQIVYHESHQSKLGGLTYNTSTPYALTFLDLTNEPAVVIIPDAPLRGAMHNMWQIGLTQMTEAGTYIFVGPGQNLPNAKEAKIIQSDTNHIFLGLRLVGDTTEERMTALSQLKIVNLKGNPISEKPPIMVETGLDAKQPRGMEYWTVLNQAIQAEPVHERDRMVMDMLAPLGMEKGQEFKPTRNQKSILEEAVVVGEAMTKVIDFNKTGRMAHAEYGPEGNTWEVATASTPNQDRGYGMDLDGRAAWFYEAVTNDIAMHGMENGGWGQVYLDNYRSEDGSGLDGGKHYALDIPAGADYAETFWTVTVYKVENRAIIDNEQGRADIGSNIEGTVANSDGSYTFHFSPEKPEKVSESNWVQTNRGENWFVYFRAYSPSKSFVNQEPQSVLPNFKEVK